MDTSSLPLTEQQNPRSHHLDMQSVEDIVDIMHQEDYHVLDAVACAKPRIAQAIHQIVKTFKSGGRLFYIGAGTSGRLGVLDATECPPTFSASPEMVQGIISGGRIALESAVEGAEDNIEQVALDLAPYHLNDKDVMIGIAASGTTPYVLEALRLAKKEGVYTVLLACNQVSEDNPAIDHYIILLVGPEILSGSTRLKSGTATKLVLNMLSTISMIQIGKVYDNLMVDLNISNEKLRQRSNRMVRQLTGLAEHEVQLLLERAHGEVKTAVLMAKKGISYQQARELLVKYEGHLRQALER